jgi:hypothetical protein
MMSRFQRRHRFRNPKKFFIIATEGECTEQIYFRSMKTPRDAAIQIKVLPAKKGGTDPKNVLARLQAYEAEAEAGGSDELWLVVDRDSWVENDLKAVARAIASHPNYRLALSNPCFELWLVLYRREASGQTCSQLAQILKMELGSYSKSEYEVESLKANGGVSEAIKRARRMDSRPEAPWPSQDGTHVYRLVEKLVSLAGAGE